MEPITYSLKGRTNSEFYEQLALFSDKILAEAEIYLSQEINLYSQFVEEKKHGTVRSAQEYIVEFISAGIFLEKYSAYATSTDVFSISLLNFLIYIRKNHKNIKTVADKLRGLFTRTLLLNRTLRPVNFTSPVFDKLIRWLNATGEYSKETGRLKKWGEFFKSLPEKESERIIGKAVAFASYFQEQAELSLGYFTYNVGSFIEDELPKHKNKEDFLFCGRTEAEYFLNMFGAEVLNRELSEGFGKTKKKAVLLPTCMSNPFDGECKAENNGMYLHCKSCSKNCEVYRIKISNLEMGVETYLIQHSSDLPELLKTWKNQNETGVVGVACILNLIEGGYEMQDLNIPSQCVFLDYCGCKKHWHKTGIPTSINQEQLAKTLKQNKISLATQKENKELIEITF
jgi:hypothetical protein